ncbi:CaiB/BaiF CoA transferase family protein [Plastoroseomonas hellenica]|uniref:CaiB/BaiF CoA transferase family protein n=1 Tax=Plastoroseomonas hellenica TaxID=2687306 RepID=UPI001BADB8A3|nr:CoA transferase [Plastoroseomonas hellenica]MBR0641679.1 CoA transferase [Plastoroseomonas hellenica]
MTTGPLAGIRVLDLSSVVVGPVATAVLAEQGAEVIKLESPEGDLLRKLGGGARRPGMSGKFLNFNRGKRSICLDVKRPAARAALHRIAAGVDVVVTNIRPEAQKRMGVDAAALTALSPRLIHCSIVGFGTNGPYAGKPAYDTVIQGVSGVAASFLPSNQGEPRYVPMLISDHVCGLVAAQMIGFALYRREKTGRGEAIEVPMFENMAAFVMMEHLGPVTFRPAVGPVGDQRVMSPEARPIATADGYVCLSANTDAQAHGFFDAIGRPELKTDPRFATVTARTRNTKDYFALRAAALAEKSTAEWLVIFEALDVPAMPYNTIEGLLDDPHLRAVGMISEAEHPSEGAIWAIGAPNSFSGGNAPPAGPSPLLGQDGVAVLREAGLDDDAIDALRRDGALIETAQEETP